MHNNDSLKQCIDIQKMRKQNVINNYEQLEKIILKNSIEGCDKILLTDAKISRYCLPDIWLQLFNNNRIMINEYHHIN